ncbi:hypothetical protein ABN222_15225 [Providencia alcalifaciens]|uniref:hypothetical protein n=1 Tax=Providencia sp. wls1921 TaxID=2675153 RepID=UPI0012B5543C|nr:hypothetical protein [Providencia sp. wls1921]HEQ1858333.1 hypothetical protein [Providencia alcalifaciens]
MSDTDEIYPSIYNKLVCQFNLLNENYSKLLNVRVDFHYAHQQPENINKAYQDMIYLYHIFKSNHGGVIGCQFVMEYSKVGGLHIHALFFINGQIHQKYYPFYFWLNDFWCHHTRGTSHTFDCNNAGNYKYSIVGDAKSYHDLNSAHGFIYLARYFSKKEQKDNIPDFYRCFVSGGNIKTSRGRPRSHTVNTLPLI